MPKKPLDASNYDTIYKAQNYLALLDKDEKAFEEYVNAMEKVSNALEKYLEMVIFPAHVDVKKIAKDFRESYEKALKEKKDMIKENKTKKATAQAFIDT